ncbi:hypothetical protein [Silvanigrella aquatica]|uniref:Uncharacterized protein n=1 Tax=Silvanigrella aquatica TaxID=1915309 RepID=A0A1L4D2X0_9BACT|nr:hypothetical protein [Silvanigrella aquatica]APJ04555.1 hypothetical protein AXG55_11820 [Silvanigrella aquatica]
MNHQNLPMKKDNTTPQSFQLSFSYKLIIGKLKCNTLQLIVIILFLTFLIMLAVSVYLAHILKKT